MSFVKLIILQPGRSVQDFEVLSDLTSIGRALDNTIALEEDTNVSRYHAEIEKRGAGFYLIDLSSSNGTTLNDEPIEEALLRDNDVICLGGSTLIEFYESDSPWRSPAPVQSAANSISPPAADLSHVAVPLPESTPAIEKPASASKPGEGMPLLFIALGVGGGLLLVGLVAVLIHSLTTPRCNPTVRIVNPRSGTTIRELTTIRVEVEDHQCIGRLIYQIDGRNLVSSVNPPYEAALDPSRLQDIEPGTHNLSVTVEDKGGKRMLQDSSVHIAFEQSAAPVAETPSSSSTAEQAPGTSANTTDVGAVPITEVRDLCIKLAKEFPSSKTNYKYDMEFLSQVQSRASEFARQGFFDRARAFRDVINTNFIDQKNLDEPLGYVLAMSRSNFVLLPGQQRAGDSGEGLWQMSQSFAQRIGYSGLCGTETISDPNQECAAMVAATYAKALITVAFEGDFVYGVACFSMNPKEAEEWASQLPQDRSDFWKIIRRPEQRERIVRFFAAGIVGENPERFNLPRDGKLSSLYPKR
ncbi:MAG TPA: FHA domain-containing protein [Pyrinomonadaceae bacterium]|nr:FHA domain-containing protein [Pyrinomonadaceae bacterium]